MHWVLITDAGADADSPTRSRHVAAPPSGTKILSVLNQKGGNEVSPDTRDLQIEIAPVGSKILQSHRCQITGARPDFSRSPRPCASRDEGRSSPSCRMGAARAAVRQYTRQAT